jgi:PGF-pre-PGF domain-containing protein
LPKFPITISSILPGKPANISIANLNTPFLSLNISVVNKVVDVGIDIKTILKIEVPVKGKLVYSYINLTSTIKKEDLEKVEITFFVEKKWINENKVDVKNVKLERFDGTNWVKLPTTKIGEDENYVYLKAISPGLSVFAITASPVAPPLPPKLECPKCPLPSDWSACIEGKQKRTNYKCGPETNYTCQPYEETRACFVPPKPKPWYEQILKAVVVLLVVVALAILLYKKLRILKK